MRRAQSSEHNLGNARTINMAGLPLELIHQRHRPRFDIALEGGDRVRGLLVPAEMKEEFYAGRSRRV
jgi:hypothetical protein